MLQEQEPAAENINKSSALQPSCQKCFETEILYEVVKSPFQQYNR